MHIEETLCGHRGKSCERGRPERRCERRTPRASELAGATVSSGTDRRARCTNPPSRDAHCVESSSTARQPWPTPRRERVYVSPFRYMAEKKNPSNRTSNSDRLDVPGGLEKLGEVRFIRTQRDPARHELRKIIILKII